MNTNESTGPDTNPAEMSADQVAAAFRHFIAGYSQMRGIDPDVVYTIHKGHESEASVTIGLLARAAALLDPTDPAAPIVLDGAPSDIYEENSTAIADAVAARLLADGHPKADDALRLAERIGHLAAAANGADPDDYGKIADRAAELADKAMELAVLEGYTLAGRFA